MKILESEMQKNSVSLYDVAELLQCTVRTVRNKLSGYAQFTVDEAFLIRDVFFPELRVDYLFSTAVDAAWLPVYAVKWYPDA